MRGDVIFVYKRLDTAFGGAYSVSSDGGAVTDGTFSSYFSYKHYGIDLGDGDVVHFTGDRPENYRIIVTSKFVFAGGGRVHEDNGVKYEFSKEETASRALSMVGDDFGRYDYLTNNCEHFTSWCSAGAKKSRQSENVKNMSKAAIIIIITILTGGRPIMF